MSKYEKSFYYRYCLVFKTGHDPILHYFKKLLSQNNFDYKEYEDKNRIILILSQTDEEKLLREAQNAKVKKVSTMFEISKHVELPEKLIEQEKKKNFVFKDKDNYVPDAYYDNLFNHKKSDERYGLDVFTEAEMLSLENKLLFDINLNQEEFLNVCRGTPIEKKIENIKKILENDQSAFHVLLQFKIIKDHFPLHSGDFKEKIFKETSLSFKIPYRNIRSYFGDYVAIYYAWMYHYTRFLIIPAVTSILIVLFSFYFPDIEKYLLTLYEIIIAICTQIFIIYWNRKCSEISIEWDNYTEEYDKENVRREFKGEWRVSPVTEKYEKYYPNSKRKITYLFSFLISLPALLVSLFVNICFLNLSGFIKPQMNSGLEIEMLGRLSEKGRIFDVDGTLNTVVVIVQGIILNHLNEIYRKIAVKTNHWENHRIKSNYDNTLIIKRFAFEFFNNFISLFYMAFVLKDFVGLKKLLVNTI
jgi:hypothetical protein